MVMRLRFIFLIIILVTITSCETKSPANLSATATTFPDSTATLAPTPEKGQASVTGQILNEVSNEPMAETIIRLAEVYRKDGTETEGAYVLDVAFSPGDISDQRGYFFIKDIPAGEYVIVIGDPYGDYDILEDEAGTAKIWKIPSDKITDLGALIANP